MYSTKQLEFDITISLARAKMSKDLHHFSLKDLVHKEMVSIVGFAQQNNYAIYASKNATECYIFKILHLSVINKILAEGYVLDSDFNNKQSIFLNQND